MITREPETIDVPVNMFARMGRLVLLSCRNAGRALLVTFEAMLYIPHTFTRRGFPEVVIQFYITGIKSLGVITVVLSV